MLKTNGNELSTGVLFTQNLQKNMYDDECLDSEGNPMNQQINDRVKQGTSMLNAIELL